MSKNLTIQCVCDGCCYSHNVFFIMVFHIVKMIFIWPTASQCHISFSLSLTRTLTHTLCRLSSDFNSFVECVFVCVDFLRFSWCLACAARARSRAVEMVQTEKQTAKLHPFHILAASDGSHYDLPVVCVQNLYLHLHSQICRAQRVLTPFLSLAQSCWT